MKLLPFRDEVKDLRKRLPTISPKLLIYSAIALGTTILIIWAFRPAPIAVDTGRVSRGDLQVTVNAEGKTRVRDRFVVSAPVDGRLARIELDEGDTVKPGTIVARIDPLPLNSSVKQALAQLAEWQAQRAGVATQRPKQATLEQAQKRIRAAEALQKQAVAKVSQAQAALTQAQRDRQRAQQLQSTGVISRKERETAELNATTQLKEFQAAELAAKAAAAEVEQARAALAVLQAQQSDPDYLLRVYDARIANVEAELSKLKDETARTVIRSPDRGQVLRILQKSAQYVTSGTPLIEVGDVSRLELVIDVLSSDAVKIKPGNPILIDRGTDTQPLRAKVRLVEPSAFTKVSALGVEEQRVNAIADFVDSPDSFGDAYRVDVKIVIWEGKNILKVPLSALFRCEKSWCVFTVKDSKASRRLVAVGQRSDFEGEIRQGLQQNQVVILHPSEQIKEGSRVTPN
ncbi:MAG: efflux RND transporter periplasmic adaptor subunit [Aulosira sp. ZfuVER01]|nr:HlyD family efflux transporter periplasmic adaptor subunit [Aulosira sp. ZfuVER01]MDZ7996680.1 HlyD family efflux transporter periplasmic adaptor subunit [Aulosira sp. DedVER01a]MDZ8053730.1 HlyD family efflux transporter periplasmic adaptor subunit [Aulosira sp. ZfuCHP01]